MAATPEQLEEVKKKFETLPSSAGSDAGVFLTFERDPKNKSIEIAQLVVRSEKSKNALSGKMISELTDRIGELESWAAREDTDVSRCLLIRGHESTFCSGSDLKTARATLDDLGEDLARLMQYNFKRISELPVVSVAHLEGYALGGGAELALAADLRIMSSSAKIGFVHAKNGICCGWSGGTRLVQLVGKSNALELLASGRLIGQEEAERLGLACEWDQGLVSNFCASHAIRSSKVSGAIKSLIQAACEMSPKSALENECQLFVSTWGKEAHRDALNRNQKHNK